jgi:hypothetical protein
MNDRILRCLPASFRRAPKGTRRHQQQLIAPETTGNRAISTFAPQTSFAFQFKYGRSKTRMKSSERMPEHRVFQLPRCPLHASPLNLPEAAVA